MIWFDFGLSDIKKKCNLTLAMSPTCHGNNALHICWHEFLECSQVLVHTAGPMSGSSTYEQYFLRYELTNYSPIKKYTSKSVIRIFPICTYESFILLQSFRFIAIILFEIWIIIQWRTDGRTDRKRCIRAHRAICTGGLKKLSKPSAKSF